MIGIHILAVSFPKKIHSKHISVTATSLLKLEQKIFIPKINVLKNATELIQCFISVITMKETGVKISYAF